MKALRYGIFALAVLLSASPLMACSDIILPGAGPVVSARTMDFEMNQYNAAVFVPRGLTWTSHAPWLFFEDGVSWKNTYGFVGIDLLGGVKAIQALMGRKYSDGMNETGLSAAVLWLDKTEYSEVETAAKALSARDLVAYTLGRFDTVEAVREGFSPSRVTVWDETVLGLVHFTLHLAVHDSKGKSLVIEWVNGAPPKFYDDDTGYEGVLTNDPVYPEQTAYLKKFSALTNEDAIGPKGDFIEGSGMLTLPGDYTPSSRFVRPAVLSKYALTELSDGDDGKVQQAFHIIRQSQAAVGENDHTDQDVQSIAAGGKFYTLWTVVRDHTSRKIYFTGTRNQSPRVIDLALLDFGLGNEPRTLALMDEYANPIALATSDPALGLNADYQLTGDGLALSITVNVSELDRGKEGQYFIFARTSKGAIRSFDGEKWVERGRREPLISCGEGALKTRTFPVLKGASHKAWEGAQFFAGYGKNEWEMYLKSQFGQVYVATSNVTPAKHQEELPCR